MEPDDASERSTPANPSESRPTSSKRGSSKHIHTHDSSHKHSKPWTARLYRKHDAKHHNQGQLTPEAAPLLTEREPEESEEEQEPVHHQHRRGCCGHAHHDVHATFEGFSGAIHWTFDKLANIAECVAKAAEDGGKAVANGAKKAGKAVHDNPKNSMAGVIAFLAASSIALGTTLVWDRVKFHGHPTELCTTPACVRAAEYILHNLDPSLVDQDNQNAIDFMTAGIDPCTDFDKFACGGFTKLYDLREDHGDLSIGMIPHSLDSHHPLILIRESYFRGQ